MMALILNRNQFMHYCSCSLSVAPCIEIPFQKTTPTCHANVVIIQYPKEKHTKIKRK